MFWYKQDLEHGFHILGPPVMCIIKNLFIWKLLKVQFTQKSKISLIKEMNQYFWGFCLWQQGCNLLDLIM